ncbi:MAG: chemotaxis protein CheA, partial [Nitrospiria bacterium]
MGEEDDILNEFLLECSENLERLDQEFVALEDDPDNADLLGSIFRAVHTIKGTCGFFGFPKLENVAHGAENILSVMRDREMPVTSEGITLLLEAVDAIKEILTHIEQERTEPERNYDGMRQRLDAFLEKGMSPVPSEASTTKEAVSPEAAEEELEAPSAEEKAPEDSKEKSEKPEKAVPQTSTPAFLPHEEEACEAPTQTTEEKLEKPAEPPNRAEKPKRSNVEQNKPALSDSTIRVDVTLLDRLINLVGELVLSRNQLLQQVRDQGHSSPEKFNNETVQQVNLITTELQSTVMKTRMQPIKNIWDKFPRVVRDLAHANGKSVELVMEGAETELDKTLLEAIRDPMTHIIRNAVDHGIETPDRRKAAGKKEKGILLLRSYHEGGHIIIQISDDGAGIDVGRVKAKALEKELISPERAGKMSEREALNLIFHPGLSTARKVTNVSGRGVGMDVVKTNIGKIGGTVSLTSSIG